MQVTPSTFKAYDIRGTTPTTLNEAVAEAVGLAFGTQALALGERTVAVGRDGRLSGPALSAALMRDHYDPRYEKHRARYDDGRGPVVAPDDLRDLEAAAGKVEAALARL